MVPNRSQCSVEEIHMAQFTSDLQNERLRIHLIFGKFHTFSLIFFADGQRSRVEHTSNIFEPMKNTIVLEAVYCLLGDRAFRDICDTIMKQF